MRLLTTTNSRERALTALGFARDGIALVRVARPRGRAPVLEHCGFHPVASPTEWERALGPLARRHGLDRSTCTIVLEEGAYALLLVEAPEVAPEELRAAVRWRIRDLVDFPIDDAVIDVFDVPPQKSAGGRSMMYVVAARVPAVRERTDAVQAARLDLAVVDVPELAQRNVAAELPEDDAGVALVYLSERSGLVTLTRRRTLYLARRIDTGLDALRGAPAPRVRSWLDTLVVELQRSFDYYESNFGQAPIASVVIAPLERPVPGICEQLAEQLQVGARLIDVADLVECPRAIDPQVQARCFPALGAALRLEEVRL